MREQHALAVTYPLHFRKTYFAARLHGDTATKPFHYRDLGTLAVISRFCAGLTANAG